MSLWDYVTRRARTSPAAWAADALTQPIPVVAEPSDPGAAWLLTLFDRQARLNAQVEVSGFRGLTDADLELLHYVPGMPLDRRRLALLAGAGVDCGTPWTAPESTHGPSHMSGHPMNRLPMQGPSEATTAPRQETS